jgi:hypothetical protein
MEGIALLGLDTASKNTRPTRPSLAMTEVHAFTIERALQVSNIKGIGSTM